MHYDNHSEKWTIRLNEGDTLSVIAERTGRAGRNLKQQGIRKSFEGIRKKPSLQRESLRNAIRASATVLSSDALANFDSKSR